MKRAAVRALAIGFLAAALSAAAFDLEGHRGARGLAPENTLAAFRRALAIGVTTLETDLAVTRDDVLVLSHDPLLNPDLVRGPNGNHETYVMESLGALRVGDRVRVGNGTIYPIG